VTAQLNARGDVAVLVPAAGSGVRLGPGAPKALRLLVGEPLLVHAVRRVAAAPSVRMIVVAAPAAEVESVRALLAPVAPVTVVPGGKERQDSVAAALAAVPRDVAIVLVHDAARALTPPTLFESVAAAIRSGHPAAIPAQPVVDTIKEVSPALPATAPALAEPPTAHAQPARRTLTPSVEGIAPGVPDGVPSTLPSVDAEAVLGTVDRSVLRSVQTPQGFRHDVLAAAHAANLHAHTDDAGMVEKSGIPVVCVPGSDLAMKITRPLDLVLAEALLPLSPPS
jgi:2-C-methyl-D-erythritol 4-phosphate cytidylyltransferase